VSASHDDGEVRVERRDGCAWVTLDRPPLNLLAPAIIDRLRAAVQALSADPEVRVAVITGAGRAMTAGMQLQVLRDLDRASARALITRLHQAINAVHDAPFPTIAMVNGACLGAGFELAMACDLCVASREARLGLPEIRVGVPSVIEAALLPGLVGPARAAELLFTGAAITAEQALAWGLVNRVVPPGELGAATAALAAEIAGHAPTALRLQKRLVIQWRTSDLRAAIAAGIEAFAETYATGEPREAASAYLEKRAPRFR
jgi:enoyl-CoA hydratase/carnithine racemase